MKTLHISVVDKVATYQKRDGSIVCGNSDYQIQFVFDSEWDAHTTKTARFIWNHQFYDQEFTGDICPVPVISGATQVEVGVYAGNLRTTTPAMISCLASILCEDAPQRPESAEVYTNEAKDAADRAEASAISASERATEAATEEVARLVGELGVVQTTGDSVTAVMSQKATTEELNKINEVVGLPCVVASGTVEAVAPAYTKITVADGITLKKGETYILKGTAITEAADYVVYLSLYIGDTSQGFVMVQDEHNGVNSKLFTVSEDCDNASIVIETGLTSGLSFTASLETVADEDLREIVERHETTLEDVNGILDTAFSKVTPSEFDGVETGKVYNEAFEEGASLPQYNTYYKAVTSGERFLLTSTLVPNANYSAASFWDENGKFLFGAGYYDDVGDRVTDYVVTVPPNAVLMRVVTPSASTPIINRYLVAPINMHDVINKTGTSVSFVDGVCVLQTPYNDTEILVIEIKRGGGNNLPDIKDVYVIDNGGARLRTIVSSGTDMFSPHIVGAKNDVDGDNLDDSGGYNEYFTGGNHQYNNSGDGSTATARCASFSVTELGNEIVVKWTNYIQGYNTTKADGTGREIMREDIRLTITDGTISADIRHTAMEDIVRKRYYGLQMANSHFDTIEFIGGEDRLIHSVGDGANSGNKECRTVRLTTGDGDVLEIAIDAIDLGNFKYNGATHNAFDTTYWKNYFNIIRDSYLTQNKDQVTTTRGYYRFFSK